MCRNRGFAKLGDIHLKIYAYARYDTPNSDALNVTQITTKEKRGIWLLPVRDSWPTTAKQVNEQSDTHAVGIYSTPVKRA